MCTGKVITQQVIPSQQIKICPGLDYRNRNIKAQGSLKLKLDEIYLLAK